MIKFIFESNVPGRLTEQEEDIRIARFHDAGITVVFVQVDDGRGASWNSQHLPINTNSGSGQLDRYVKKMRASGFKVYLVFNIIGIFLSDTPIRPEYLLQDLPPHLTVKYNIWLPEFVAWRTAIIQECLSQVPCDGVALDFIRSQKEQTTEPTSASIVVRNALASFRSVHDYPMFNMSDSLFVNNPAQGVQVADWLYNKFIDEACLFNYRAQWPSVSAISEFPIWALGSSYKTVEGVLQPKSYTEIVREIYAAQRKMKNMKAYGLYLANLFTDEQAEAMRML